MSASADVSDSDADDGAGRDCYVSSECYESVYDGSGSGSGGG